MLRLALAFSILISGCVASRVTDGGVTDRERAAYLVFVLRNDGNRQMDEAVVSVCTKECAAVVDDRL